MTDARAPACEPTGVVLAIVTFFLAHWFLSVFFQSFYLHRYCAHGMFTMSKGWERFFQLCTFVFQGSSYLMPSGYAALHREHHAFSDTARDPHSPHVFTGFWRMMEHTKNRYRGILEGSIEPEARFVGNCPSWPLLDELGSRWSVRLAFGFAYTVFYVVFAPHWALFLLLPIHYLMGPVHGAIVNWAGHKYGYRNYETRDQSRNTLAVELVTAGELFQNNHHKNPASVNFGARWFEIDPTYQVMRVMRAVGIIAYPDVAPVPMGDAELA
jgi:stearoyl-CoA desaturase (delta-9 desaturase)